MKRIWNLLVRVGAAMFGSLSWSPPAWMHSAGQRLLPLRSWAGRHRRVLAALAVLMVAGLAAYPLVKSRMPYIKPDKLASSEAGVRIIAPGRTELENDGLPQALRIEFSASAAPLARVGREAGDIQLSPAIAGKWTWNSDHELSFQPAQDWPVGQTFTIRFGAKALAPQVKANKEYAFETARFAVTVANAEFYQDPTQFNLRKGVFEVKFTHPVVPADFEKRLRMDLDGKPARFTLTYDKWKVGATIQSEPLAIPQETAALTLHIEAGLKAQRGGDGTPEEVSKAVAVPGLFGLEIQAIETQIVTGQSGDMENVLRITTGMAVNEKEAGRMVSAWALPAATNEAKAWDDPADVTDAVLQKAKRLALPALPQERDNTEVHAFKFEADPGSFIFVRIAKGMKSVGGYQLGQKREAILQVKASAPELSIMGTGALLALNGERKLPIMVRDIPGVKIEIGRVLPHQLHFLATHAEGNYANPQFYRGVTPDSLTERFEKKLPLKLAPGKTHFETIDFSEYLKTEGSERRGIFLVKIQGYDPASDAAAAPPSPQQGGGEGEGEGEGQEQYSGDAGALADSRLIMLTDLGLVSKRAVDGAQQVYVQSISSGAPVAGATVEVWGRNGLILHTQASDAGGVVRLPDLRGYTREKQAVLLVVKKAGDTAFMALNRNDRALDMSRFDVGGTHSGGLPNQMRAYLFSDRGIYRPGDTIQAGIIVKSGDWSQNLKDLPVEAEVVDARGQTVRREMLKLGPAGMAELAHPTLDSAPTGNYTIYLNLPRDGAQGEPVRLGATTVKVQEFLPDRTKVALKLSAAAGEGWVSPQSLTAQMTVQNLFGTPAPNRKVEAVVTLTPAYPAFASWPGYSFYDPQRAKERFTDTIADQKTDEQGDVSFDLGLHRYQSATYQLHVLARAFEPEGGRSVSAEVQSLVSDAPYLVGYKADGDLNYISRGAARGVHLIAIDPKARKTAVAGLTLERYENRVLSVLVKQSNGLFKYESRGKDVLLKSEPFAIGAGGAQLAPATDTPGNFTYVLKNAQGAALAQFRYSVAGSGNVTRSLDRNAELQLTLNKKDYQPGEEIEISVRAPYTGAGLITIERDKVYASKWFKADQNASVQKITLPKDYDGNGYVMVQFTRAPSSDEIYMSPLSYGVAPFATSLERRTTKIALKAPELVKPGQTVQFHLDAPKPVRAVVFAVDEGILQVARYQAPNPLQYFFQKRALEVTTAQTLDQILPEFRKLMQGAAPGGDADGEAGKHLNPFKRKRDKPVAYWSGIVDVKGGRDFSYTVPDYFNGSLRVMAVAVDDSSAAAASARTTVRGDIVLLPNVPVALTPGDEAEVGIGVANNIKGSGKGAPVALTLQVAPALEVLGKAQVTLAINEGGEATARFRVRARSGAQAQLGSAGVVFSAQYQERKAKLATDLSVRPASALVTLVQTGRFKGGGEIATQGQFYPQMQRSELSVSATPWSLASGMLRYLQDYPYGCTEQMISQMTPAVLLANRPDIARELQAARAGSGAVPDPKKAFERMLTVLRARQTGDGGFGLYAPGESAHPFATVYAAQLLLDAREHKMPVPEDLLARSLGWLQNYAAQGGGERYGWRWRTQAAYLLTRSGAVTTAALVNLRGATPKDARGAAASETDLGNAYLAASYQILKQDQVARQLLDPLWKDLLARLAKKDEFKSWGWYYDSLVHDATLVTLVARHFPNRLRDLPPEAFERMAAWLSEGWYSSLSAAAVVTAVDAYSNAAASGAAGAITARAVDRQGKEKALELGALNVIARTAVPADAARLKIGSSGGLPLYYALAETGFERNVPATAASNGIEIIREFVDAAGKPLAEATLGDEVTVRVRVRAVGRSEVQQVALVDVLPGGLEPVLSSPSEEDSDAPLWQRRVGTKGWSWNVDYVDLREDRVIIFGNVGSHQTEITYKVRATNVGEFVVPGAYGEAMYERKVFGRSAGSKLVIRDRQ
ncbi:alpha-2-macroglobulin family protein [Pseudoduganella violaceinigra]|uniref:alpha-2-macroglobulin family protein n=1 Tax=Pseudoduganella violaceinigra TaxID=246602 RepID=UPI0004042F9B|nr:alpha-2-macroglobulin [Pseudoduganella violaceinigra]